MVVAVVVVVSLFSSFTCRTIVGCVADTSGCHTYRPLFSHAVRTAVGDISPCGAGETAHPPSANTQAPAIVIAFRIAVFPLRAMPLRPYTVA